MSRLVFLLLAIGCSTHLFGDDFEPESALDCLDRFQEMVRKVSKNGAVLGSANVTSIDQPHLSKKFEWFLVDQQWTNNESNRRYSESRILYPHAPNSNVWEKRYIAEGKLNRSLGDYLDPLKEVKRDDDEEESKYLSRQTVGAPNLFALAACGPALLLKDTQVLNQVLNQHKVLEEERDNGDIVGKFYGINFVSEIRFSKKASYLPAEMKSYFYSPKQPGAAPSSPDDYKILWSESLVKWERVADETDIWAPVEVKSILHRISPGREQGQEVEAIASWEFDLKESLLSDDNIELLPLGGPVSDLRKHMLTRKTAVKQKVR
jgi:hypothetical protein